MGKQRNITPRVAQSYDDAFKAFNEVVKQGKGNTGFGSLGSEASSTFRGYNTGIGSSDYDKNLSWNANIDEEDVQGSLNEFRANEQSALDHLGIGAVRTVAKAATEVLKLPGVIGGIAAAPFAEENEGFETAFNNQWIKYFDGLNENVKEALPVYVKESVANGDFFTKIGSSAFYATEGADGAGYMLGALAPGGLFKYFGGAGKLFGTSIKAAKLAKYGEGMEAGRKAIKAAGITINNIDSYMIPAFNTIAEAGAESKGAWDAMESRKDEAHEEYMSKLNPNNSRFQTAISLKNEELDQLRRSGEISIDEYNQQSANIHNVVAEEMFEKDFKEQKALAAQNTFFKNAVILAGPNYIQAKLLFGKTPSKVLSILSRLVLLILTCSSDISLEVSVGNATFKCSCKASKVTSSSPIKLAITLNSPLFLNCSIFSTSPSSTALSYSLESFSIRFKAFLTLATFSGMNTFLPSTSLSLKPTSPVSGLVYSSCS